MVGFLKIALLMNQMWRHALPHSRMPTCYPRSHANVDLHAALALSAR